MTAAADEIGKVLLHRDAWRDLALALDELLVHVRAGRPRKTAAARTKVERAVTRLRELGIDPSLASAASPRRSP